MRTRGENLQKNTHWNICLLNLALNFIHRVTRECVSSGESHISMPTLRLIINRLHIPLKASPQQTLFLKPPNASETLHKSFNRHVKRQNSFPQSSAGRLELHEVYVYQKSLFLLPPPLMKHWCSSLNLTSDSLCNFNASLCQKNKNSVSLSVILSLVCVKVAEENLVSFVPSEAVS